MTPEHLAALRLLSLAIGTGTASIVQTVIGPEALMPAAWVGGAISAVATGAFVGAWTIRGHLESIHGKFDKVHGRLDRIEAMLDRRKVPREEV